MDRESFQKQAEAQLDFLGDKEAAEQIAERVAYQYAPAVRAAPDAAAKNRAWEALRFYLTARPTLRKPFVLSPDDAQRAIEALESLVGEADA